MRSSGDHRRYPLAGLSGAPVVRIDMRACPPRAQHERKRGTSSSTRTTSKRGPTSVSAVNESTRKELLSGRSRVRVAVGAPLMSPGQAMCR